MKNLFLLTALIGSSSFLYSDLDLEDIQEDQEIVSIEPAIDQSEESSEEVAIEENQEKTQEEHVSVNSRPIDETLLEQIQQERLEEAAEEDEYIAVPIIPTQGYEYSILERAEMAATCADLYANCTQSLECFATSGNLLRLQDGSEWTFDPCDASALQQWREHDEIIITPRQPVPWNQTYNFVLTNINRNNSSVCAKITLGPCRNGSWTTWVYGLNRDGRTANLLSGQGTRTTWEIAPSDYLLFKEWEHNDTIIIGYNNSYLWWLSSFDHILYNVNNDQYVRAKCTSFASFRSTPGAS